MAVEVVVGAEIELLVGEVFNDGPLGVVKGVGLLPLANVAEGDIDGVEEMKGGVDPLRRGLGLREEVFEESNADEAGGGGLARRGS